MNKETVKQNKSRRRSYTHGNRNQDNSQRGLITDALGRQRNDPRKPKKPSIPETKTNGS